MLGRGIGLSRCPVEHVGLVLTGEATAAFDDGRVIPLRAGNGREGIALGAIVPNALVSGDLDGALRVVTFDQPQVASMVPPATPIATWNDMPPVSADFDRARQAIRANVRALLDELERSNTFGAA